MLLLIVNYYNIYYIAYVNFEFSRLIASANSNVI